MSVDLPAPLSPSSPTTSPGLSWKPTSSRTCTPPKDLYTCRSSRRGGTSVWMGADSVTKVRSSRMAIGGRVARRPRKAALPDLLRHEGFDDVDVAGIDETATRVDEQTAEAIRVAQAQLGDRLEALEVLL